VCVRVCVCVYMCVCVYVSMYICIYVCIDGCIYLCICLCMYICISWTYSCSLIGTEWTCVTLFKQISHANTECSNQVFICWQTRISIYLFLKKYYEFFPVASHNITRQRYDIILSKCLTHGIIVSIIAADN